MLLTITTTRAPATDLGYLLHKNPGRPQAKQLAFGTAHVFYPEATDARCTAALLLEVDPVALVRGKGGAQSSPSFSLGQYVNDRPYAASSLMSVAIAQVFGSALAGTSRERAEVATMPLPLTATVAALPCRGGEGFLRRLFEPLGYAVAAEHHPLDPAFPDWGEGPHFTVTLTATVRLADLLGHLYVLIPVLDDQKHYFVGPDEVSKLLRHGERWLATHPERDAIADRYLKRRRALVRDALQRLSPDDPAAENADEADVKEAEEQAVEKPIRLNRQRMEAVLAELKASGAASVLDLGCNTGTLLRDLLADRQFTKIVGVDVSTGALDVAESRLNLDRLPPAQRERIELWQGSLTYRDARLAGFDAAAVVEVIEHLDPPRLGAFERSIFAFARPRVVVVTTPNAEYNANFPTLPAGRFRHRDHRFEWTRAEFQSWATAVADRHGYAVRFAPVGPVDEAVGAPTQMGVFERADEKNAPKVAGSGSPG